MLRRGLPRRGARCRPCGCRLRRLVFAALLLPAAAAVAAVPPRPSPDQAPATLKIATWNLEWLIAPEALKPLKTRCAPKGTAIRGDVRRVPCDVARRFERSSRDFAVLARYARDLDADIVALQEVDGSQAGRLVFPDYEFCFTGRRHVQNTGFAVRRGIPFRCAADVRALSLDDTLRRGAELVVFPGASHELRLLSVHLKSGCSEKPLNGSDRACRSLSRQIPALEAWIDAQAQAGRRFAVLGDFNRNLLGEQASKPTGQASLWAAIDDGDPPGARLTNAASDQPFRNCAPGQGYHAYIDNIVLSARLASDVIPGTFSRLTYTAADMRHARLSDHCPVSIRLRLNEKARPHA